jgi:hypothetical protein
MSEWSNRQEDAGVLTEAGIEWLITQIRAFPNRVGIVINAASDLPHPEVQVTHKPAQADPDKGTTPASGDVQVDVVISRDNRGRSYTGIGQPADAIRKVINDIIADPYTREWVR